ncbi:TetR family transcriptional regulator [Henriciella sp. AS95]|uniref:TetR/AcrR family transcriptional regulator n=1 Tax=Henriciella sp. AS95 TaxID=3135782 RepID=UPI003174273A
MIYTGLTQGTGETTIDANERLLRAAISLIGENGPDLLTHRMIAEEAGLSPGTATYHFSSLDVLIERAFALYIADYESALEAALTAKPMRTLRDVTTFLTRMTALDASDAELARIEYSMILYARHNEALHDLVSHWSGLLQGAVADGLRAASAPSPDFLAGIAVSFCRGIEIEVLSKASKVDDSWMRSRLDAIFKLFD